MVAVTIPKFDLGAVARRPIKGVKIGIARIELVME
jgi:hypothetical protein